MATLPRAATDEVAPLLDCLLPVGDKLADASRLATLTATGLLDSPPEDGFDRLTRLAAKLLEAPVALFSLVDDHRQFFKSACGLPEAWASRRETPLSHSLCKYVVARGGPLVVKDARVETLLRDNGAVAEAGLVAYIGVPLALGDEHTVGVLCAFDTVPRSWTPHDLEILTELARCVLTEVDLRSRVYALEASQAARAAEERLLASVVESIDDPIVVTGLHGETLLANEAARRHRSSVQCVGEGGLFLPDGGAPCGDASPNGRACRGERVRDAEVVVRHPGSVGPSWYVVNATPLRNGGGEVVGAVSVGRDVTAARNVQLALQASEGRYLALLESLPNASVMLFDHQHRCLLADGEHLLKKIGLSKATMEGRTLQELRLAENHEAMAALHRSALEGHSGELEIERAGRNVEIHSAPVRDARGAIVAAMMLAYDITAHKAVETALRDQTQFLSLLHAITLAANQATTSEEALQVCLDEVAMHMDWAVGHAFVREGEALVSTSLWHFADELSGPSEQRDLGPFIASSAEPRLPVGEGLINMAFAARQPRWARAIGASRTFRRSASAAIGGLESGYAFPVLVANEVVAVLEFYSLRDEEPDSSVLAVMSAVVTQVACVLERERTRALLSEHAVAVRRMSLRDELSGLYNRRGFMELAQQQLEVAEREQRWAALFFADLNGMKPINDTLGHEVGDRALVDTAELLRSVCREPDVVARLGGDEFVVLARIDGAQSIESITGELQQAIASFNARGDRPYRLSLSIGVATYDPRAPRSVDELLGAADKVMYEQKQQRRFRGSVAPRAA